MTEESRTLQGIGVSPGVAFGPALIVRLDVPDVPNRGITPDQADAEVARLHEAVAAVVETLSSLRDRVLQRAGREESHIFDAQILMVQDSEVLDDVERLIRQNQLSAETAYEFKALETRALWVNSGEAMLRDRLADLAAIQIRVLQRLLGKQADDMLQLPAGEQVIVVARELAPGLTVQLDRDHVLGAGERGRHPDLSRGDPRSLTGPSRRHGCRWCAGPDRERHHAPSGRTERHHPARSRPAPSWSWPGPSSPGVRSCSSSSTRRFPSPRSLPTASR